MARSLETAAEVDVALRELLEPVHGATVLHEDRVADLDVPPAVAMRVAAGRRRPGRGRPGRRGRRPRSRVRPARRPAWRRGTRAAPPAVASRRTRRCGRRRTRAPPPARSFRARPPARSMPTAEKSSAQIAADSSSRAMPKRGAPEKTVTYSVAGSRPSGLGEEAEEPRQLFGLEVRAETPVPEHLEEGRVSRVAHLVDVLGAKAGLRIHETVAGRMRLAQEIRDQRLHPRAGEQRRRVLAWDETRPRDDGVPASGEVVEVGLAKFARSAKVP